MKRWCVNITGVSGGTDTRKGAESIFEMLSENFSKMRKTFKPQIQNIAYNSRVVNTTITKI